jgi:hypothetical protein
MAERTMTDHELDAAAERLIQREAAVWGMIERQAALAVARAWLARPRWRERPTEAGRYALAYRSDIPPRLPEVMVIVDNLENLNPLVRFFGPLPPDTEATDARPETPG